VTRAELVAILPPLPNAPPASERLAILRATAALRVAMGHLEHAKSANVKQAAELVILAAELLIASGDLADRKVGHGSR
jgi:hypothetical protein